MADDAPLNPALIDAISRTGEEPPTSPAGSEPSNFVPRMGHALDMPTVDFSAAVAAFDADTNNRFTTEVREVPGAFDGERRPFRGEVRVPLSTAEIAARDSRRDALVTNITRAGATRIAQHFSIAAEHAAALTARLERLDERLAELEPDSKTGLGEIGEYSHDEYGAKVAPLLAERRSILATLADLRADVTLGEEVREMGPWASGLRLLFENPALARRYVENLHSTPGVEPVKEVPEPPPAPSVDLDKLDRLRYRTGRRAEKVEATYATLRTRDRLREELADAERNRRADEAAEAGASSEVVSRLRPRRSA
jgi:hypothetical protein